MMEQLSENNAAQGEEAVAAPSPSPGAILREARERLGLSVADVAGQIKFAPRQIEALEADNFQRLPEMTFVRGFVRSYARILHLEPQPLLALLPQPESAATPLMPPSVEAPFPNPHSLSRRNLIWLGAALALAVLVVVFAVWHYTTPRSQVEAKLAQTAAPAPAETRAATASPGAATETAAAPAAAQAKPESAQLAAPAKASADQTAPRTPSANPPVPSGAPSSGGILRLVFDDESWVEVRDKDSQMLSSQVNPRGSELRLDGHAPLSLVIGRASSVQLYYRGKQVDLKPHISATSDVARLTLE